MDQPEINVVTMWGLIVVTRTLPGTAPEQYRYGDGIGYQFEATPANWMAIDIKDIPPEVMEKFPLAN